MRVAGKMAGQRLAGSPSAANGSANRPVTVPGVGGSSRPRAVHPPLVKTAGRATGRVARGLGGFFRPFSRIGGILFLEVVGVFFLLFVLVFGQTVWKTRMDYAHGPEHQKFLVAVAMTLLFLYLGISSFWRARRK